MAISQATLPNERPQVQQPDGSLNVRVTPAMFGGGEAEGLVAFGQGAQRAGAEWGTIVADDVANQFQENANKLLYGDPNATVPGPDGKPVPDQGYMGLRGRNALDQRKTYEQRLEKLFREAQSKVPAPRDQRLFDNLTRRYRAIISGQMGSHSEREAKVYQKGVNDASRKLAIEGIAADPENPDNVAHHAADIIRTNMAEVNAMGGDEKMAQEAVRSGKQMALVAQLRSIGAKNPSRAMSILEDNKEIAGSQYDNLYNAFRARADVQDGTERADRMLGVGQVPPAGDDTKAVIRHFEQFKPKAYWDVNHWRVGYGSDTYTTADGKTHTVTKDTVVTQEDAERDLERRAALSQKAVRDAVGGEAFDKLSDRAKASLTSIAYNYGDNGIPRSVVDAAKTGDPDKIADAIRGLSGHNGGINKNRRASEANNVALPRDGSGRPSIRDQAEMLQEVMNDPDLQNRPQAQAAALHRINQVYAIHHNDQIRRKAAFQTQVEDSAAEALRTGATTNPISKEQFVQQFGDLEGPVKYQAYIDDVTFGADMKSLETLSDTQQQQLLATREPKPGDGYAHAAKNFDRLQKSVAAYQKQRREDPAGSVDRMPAVREAWAQVDRNDPSTYQRVIQARLAAQRELKIPEELQTPITKQEALKLTEPLDRALPGQEVDALRQVGGNFRQLYGPLAPKAFAYAISAKRHAAKTMEEAGAILLKLSRDEPITREEAAEHTRRMEEEAAAKALLNKSTPTEPEGREFLSPLPTQTGPRPSPFSPYPQKASVEGSPVVAQRNVPPAAIELLLNDPNLEKQFDEKYGSGRAKEILTKYKAGAAGTP